LIDLEKGWETLGFCRGRFRANSDVHNGNKIECGCAIGAAAFGARSQ
jgi:hypothetical protein